jgi:hypothetical protein
MYIYRKFITYKPRKYRLLVDYYLVYELVDGALPADKNFGESPETAGVANIAPIRDCHPSLLSNYLQQSICRNERLLVDQKDGRGHG